MLLRAGDRNEGIHRRERVTTLRCGQYTKLQRLHGDLLLAAVALFALPCSARLHQMSQASYRTWAGGNDLPNLVCHTPLAARHTEAFPAVEGMVSSVEEEDKLGSIELSTDLLVRLR